MHFKLIEEWDHLVGLRSEFLCLTYIFCLEASKAASEIGRICDLRDRPKHIVREQAEKTRSQG